MSLVFEWDPRKARSNFRKHRISFEHSTDEFREIIIGHSAAKHLLLVCFTEPATDHIRIVSARRATRAEQHDYETHIAG